MSTRQSGLEISNVQSYRDKLFSFLGDRDPLDVLGQTASALQDIVRENSAEVLRTRPFQGKWTPNEIIGHLSDSEWVNGYRTRLILCEDNPTILGMNQDFWVTCQRHNDRSPSELVEMFRDLRRLNLRSWKAISSENLKRTGHHNERGPESLGLMLRMLAGHDLSHLDQIHRFIGAVRNAA
jgi:DinB family protein